jgi:hypothetical protein
MVLYQNHRANMVRMTGLDLHFLSLLGKENSRVAAIKLAASDAHPRRI